MHDVVIVFPFYGITYNNPIILHKQWANTISIYSKKYDMIIRRHFLTLGKIRVILFPTA